MAVRVFLLIIVDWNHLEIDIEKRAYFMALHNRSQKVKGISIDLNSFRCNKERCMVRNTKK